MENYPNQFSEVFIEEIKRRLFIECFPRLEQCLHTLTEEDIWYRPNANSNSVGNITLHLCGNVRQWVIAGLGGHQDVRERQKELKAARFIDCFKERCRGYLKPSNTKGFARKAGCTNL